MPADEEQTELGSILVLSPSAEDAAEIARVLGAGGMFARILPGRAALPQQAILAEGADVAALFLAEEALEQDADAIAGWLAAQPPWSDFPIVVLAAAGRQAKSGSRLKRLERLGNVTLLERPVHPETLQSAARVARRTRARQLATRRHLEALQSAAETLETRVEERTHELMEVEASLRQSQKMEAVGRLTGGIAHDFNNLLVAISGSLEMLKVRLDQGRLGELDRYIDVAQGAASRAAALTHRLLAFSRRQTLDPKPVQANQLIANMEELVRRTVGPEIAIETKLAANLNLTLCDPHQLENALLNLCINARDAMPDGGRLILRTRNSWVTEEIARERDVAMGGYVAISVEDNGTGMTPEVMAQAFEPFFTTKPLGQGTGLGLSMVYGFARQSGGQVRIYSDVGQGTTVRIFLPEYAGEADSEPPQAGPAELARAEGGKTVLVVDDEPAVRILLGELLNELGYVALEAADGIGGLKVLQSDAPVDLLISDVGLPGGMNGRQMAEVARQTRPDLKILFITGYAETAVLGSGKLPPGMQVLTKPFAMETMALRIKGIFAGNP